eukprot:6476825-Amphidinium_carterae.1
MKERGRPHTLVLIQLPTRVSKKRPPGPGPTRKNDTAFIGKKYLAHGHARTARAHMSRGLLEACVIEWAQEGGSAWENAEAHPLP